MVSAAIRSARTTSGATSSRRLIYGSRISLLVGFTAVIIAGCLGVTSGFSPAYYGGRLDALIMRLADVQLAFPFILLAISVIAVLGPGLRNVIIVSGCPVGGLRPASCARRCPDCPRARVRRGGPGAGRRPSASSCRATSCPTSSHPSSSWPPSPSSGGLLITEASLSFLGG